MLLIDTDLRQPKVAKLLGMDIKQSGLTEYLAGIAYGAICESYTSELAARRTAMDSATGNAEAMIEDLSLRYNRARQSAITQEITEIIGGSEAE